jgi:hypothetical protein
VDADRIGRWHEDVAGWLARVPKHLRNYETCRAWAFHQWGRALAGRPDLRAQADYVLGATWLDLSPCGTPPTAPPISTAPRSPDLRAVVLALLILAALLIAVGRRGHRIARDQYTTCLVAQRAAARTPSDGPPICAPWLK